MMNRYRLFDGWQVTTRHLVWTWTPGMFWFRFRFGGRLAPGLRFVDARTGWVPFSVRHGYQRALFVGPFVVTYIGWGIA